METIQIDNDVFSYLQKNAHPFIDTPNSTLRRLLGIDDNSATSNEVVIQNESYTANVDDLIAEGMRLRRTKAPKADLKVLINNGTLKNGQRLYLIDYQGNKFKDKNATISNNRLFYNNHTYSMSELAEVMLKELGFESDSVRGPAHWLTEDGLTIKDLWTTYLKHQ